MILPPPAPSAGYRSRLFSRGLIHINMLRYGNDRKKNQEPDMPTNAQLAADLLRNAAIFFREVGVQNPPIKEKMSKSADTFDTVAKLVEANPNAEMPDLGT